ncbi:MAG: sigma-70 family RNA polymerase sigma factor [Geminicoccaceae bacterium]
MGDSSTTREVFEQQLISLLPILRRYAVAMTGSLSEGDDAVQLTVVRALERRDQYRGGRLDAWLLSIMRSVWRNQLKQRRRELPFDDRVISIASRQAVEALNSRLILHDVDRILATLPAEWRELALLVCVYGYSYRQASVLLGLKIGTVMSRLNRMRTLISEELRSKDQASRKSTDG